MRVTIISTDFPPRTNLRWVQLISCLSRNIDIKAITLRIHKPSIEKVEVMSLIPKGFSKVKGKIPITMLIYSFLMLYSSLNRSSDIIWILHYNPLFVRIVEFICRLLDKPVVLDLDDPISPLSVEQYEEVYGRWSPYKLPYLWLPRHLAQIFEASYIRTKNLHLVVTSPLIKRFFFRLGLSESRIHLIPTGVDLKKFKMTPLPEEPVIIYSGTTVRRRITLLAKAMEYVWLRIPEAQLIINGPINNLLRQLHAKNREKVILTGFVPHDTLPAWISKARVCTYPDVVSLGGRFIEKFIEYMALGRPIVSTNVVESWLIKASNAGLITERNPEAFANAILRLLEDDDLARKLSKNARTFAEKFPLEKTCKMYLRLFHSICSR